MLERESRKSIDKYLRHSDEMTEEELWLEFVEYKELRWYNLSIVDLVLEALSSIFSCHLDTSEILLLVKDTQIPSNLRMSGDNLLKKRKNDIIHIRI